MRQAEILQKKANERVAKMGARKIIQNLLDTDQASAALEKYGAKLDALRFLDLWPSLPT